MGEPARITIEQRIEWSDTDASGHHHHSAMLRMAAVAEAELFERLGLADELYGGLPRVHLSLNLHTPLRFRARLAVELAITEVGRTSIDFSFTIRTQGAIAADGRVVAVRVGDDGRPVAWTDRQRGLLLGRGDVTAGTS